MTSSIIYEGDLRTTCTHLKSGQSIITDAPTDNHGKGEAFSPTDLLATSLGSCMLTVMGIVADRNDININGTKANITKAMTENPRRVAEIVVEIIFPNGKTYSDKEKALLENAAKSCPVAKSLHTDIDQKISFHY
ncbi:MAG: OsmC family protein [Bacteroidota bacterium]|jgi:putative redox protein